MDKLGLGLRLQRMALVKREIMNEIAHNSLDFFKEKSFDNEGFTDKSLERWPQRKDGDTSRRLLVNTGRGRASIHIKSVNVDKAKIVAEAEYMKYHNEGTNVKAKERFQIVHLRNQENDFDKKTGKYKTGVRFVKKNKAHYAQKVKVSAHEFKIPKREFMGDSSTLNAQNRKIIDKHINKVL